jgi:hypothetical protein
MDLGCNGSLRCAAPGKDKEHWRFDTRSRDMRHGSIMTLVPL